MEYKNDPSMSATESEKIKNNYDRRIAGLDSYKTILSKIEGLDYRFPSKVKSPEDSFDEEAAEKNNGR
jgi:hypothetical protein